MFLLGAHLVFEMCSNSLRFIACLSLLACACEPKEGAQSEESLAEASPSFEQARSAPYDYQRDQAGALLTYVRADGSFAVAEKLSEIPETNRKHVRVVRDDQPPGSAEVVYVGDLSGPGPRYSLKSEPRKTWEALGAEARALVLKELAPEEESSEDAVAHVDVVLYGASWCGACKAAEAYLKKRGVRLIKKDIEEEPGARKEMQSKMKASGLSGSSIPVIDVGGTIIIGASQKAIDAALARATR